VLGKDYSSDSARINENERDNTAMIAECANVGVVKSDDHREQGSAMPDIVSHGWGMERQRQTGRGTRRGQTKLRRVTRARESCKRERFKSLL
jgi:hypothetical protein